MGLGSFTEVVQGGFGNLGDMARHRVSHLCPAQLAPVTCSISNSPGDHRAGNKPDIHHYYHNDDGGSYRDDDSAMTMSNYIFKTTTTKARYPGSSHQTENSSGRGIGMP